MPAGRPSILSSHLPLAARTADWDLILIVVSIGLKITVPVTTGVPILLNTSTLTSTGSFVSVAATEMILIFVGSLMGSRSAASGCHLPSINERKLSALPRKTFKSTRALGTPYF